MLTQLHTLRGTVRKYSDGVFLCAEKKCYQKPNFTTEQEKSSPLRELHIISRLQTMQRKCSFFQDIEGAPDSAPVFFCRFLFRQKAAEKSTLAARAETALRTMPRKEEKNKRSAVNLSSQTSPPTTDGLKATSGAWRGFASKPAPTSTLLIRPTL